jgi:hypothetical protein
MIALGVASAKVYALEPTDVLLFSKDPFLLKPQFSVSETFNDNIFYRDEDPISDFITTVSPGLDLQVGSQDYNFLKLSYRYDQLLYARETSQNAGQHRIGITDHFEYSRFTLSGLDRIEMLSSPLGGGISFRGEKVSRTTYYDLYQLAYDLSEKTSPYAEVSHSTTDFEEGVPLYDYTTLQGTLGFAYKAFSRTSFFGEFYYGQTSSDPNELLAPYPTATFYGAFLGARGNFTEKLTGMLKVGYELRSYDLEDSGTSGLPVVEMNLTEQFSERTTFTLDYAHRQLESVQFTASAYTIDSVFFGVVQQIGNEDRFRARLNAGYSQSSFEPNPVYLGDRTDHLISAGLTVSYDFKLWLRGYLGYNFEYLDSTTPVVFDYEVNRVTLGITLGY